MNEQEKQEYLEGYKKAKEKGVPFFPDILFKDAVVSLVIFLALIGLAYFLGTPLEARADPADSNYTPRPEWYFLFLFQLLKYFPGQLEVVGVFVIPTLAILILFGLPFLDRSRYRTFNKRPVITGAVALAVVGVIFLTIQSIRETPPPAEAASGDQIAELYASNCAPCHGASISVPTGFNLHAMIAQGKHDEGMPAWSADLTTDEIDALAGFILSPEGSQLFTAYCFACHEAPELVAGDPLELKTALDEGSSYPSHAELDVPQWKDVLSRDEITSLLNFLVAPDGQRLFAINCAPCHGRAVAFSGEESELRTIISQGGLHLEMPPWREQLSEAELDTLARYVVDPAAAPESQELFQLYCSSCHGERVPVAESLDQARQTIASGGAHETMPVWGDALTPDQLDALVSYTLEAAQGTPLEVGQDLYTVNCALCHGDLGEGGLNPSRPDDIIAPISSAEFLKTRDDFTLRSIISQGQPNFGMSPFGSAYGGPLDDDEVEAIVAYVRAWEKNPPVELPPEVRLGKLSLGGEEIYVNLCAQCHGLEGESLVGPSLYDAQFQAANSDQDIFDTINQGHGATSMVAWGEILSAEQIQQLVDFIRNLKPAEEDAATQPTPVKEPTAGAPSFAADVLPILNAKCSMCHGTFGGWDGSSYEAVMTTGDNAPVVIPGDAEGSLFTLKLLGTMSEGTIMPPGGKLPDDEIQVIMDWIAAGAEDN